MAIVLPKSTEPQGNLQAQQALRRLRNDGLKVVMVVFGDDAAAKNVATVVERAVAHRPAMRELVRCPDSEVLRDASDYADIMTAADQGYGAVVLDLDFNLVSRLSPTEARDSDAVEGAFLQA